MKHVVMASYRAMPSVHLGSTPVPFIASIILYGRI